MPRELFWLSWTVVLTGLIWVPYILDRFATRGIMGTFDNPMPDSIAPSTWAYRMRNAHANAVENLAVFAPLVLILNALAISTPATITASAIFFWARLAHVIVYTIGIPVLRTLLFLVGFGCQVVLALAIFGVI